MSLDINKAITDVQGIASTVKDTLSEVQTAQTTSSTDTTSSTTETPMIAKSTTVILMWIIVGFTMFLFLLAIACLVIFNKDITGILTQSMGYSVPVTITCLAKRGVENYATIKNTNK